MKPPEVNVIGAGPAGLMAAEILARGGAQVTVIDRMASPGRKFLMAGRGGLNLTHSEPLEKFLGRYGEARSFLEPAIRAFPPSSLIEWCHGLGIETFVGSSGRVFPRQMKASPLLRAWLRRLDGLGVVFKLNTRWTGETPGDATILAMGGASWPRLGSDAQWMPLLNERGVVVNEFLPSNSSVMMAWSQHFKERFAGTPLKRIAVTCKGRTMRGEAVVTARGLEGGAVYALFPELRTADVLSIDLRPDLTGEDLAARLARPRGKSSTSTWLRKAAGLSPVAIALLRETQSPPETKAIKALAIRIAGTDTLARAISSAGGIAHGEVSPDFELKSWRGVYAAGEMLDWEAPTGGYLLQACFSTGFAAARGGLERLNLAADRPQSAYK